MKKTTIARAREVLDLSQSDKQYLDGLLRQKEDAELRARDFLLNQAFNTIVKLRERVPPADYKLWEPEDKEGKLLP